MKVATKNLALTSACETYSDDSTPRDFAHSCGAIPPQSRFPSQPIHAFISQFQIEHGFVSTGPGSIHDDGNDFVMGDQSVKIVTDGQATDKLMKRVGISPSIDFTGMIPKIWVKVENVNEVAPGGLILYLGDSNLANHYKFIFHGATTQKWVTEGTWVSLTLSWSGATTVGNPNRAAITDIGFGATDRGISPVTLHVNGIALVPEPELFPHGVVTFSFDDGLITTYTKAKPMLAAKGFPGVAYPIAQRIGSGPEWMSITQLKEMQSLGWEVGAHSFTIAVHSEEYANLSQEDAERDIILNRNWLIVNGFTGYDDSAVPHGNFSTGPLNAVPIFAKYFASSRTSFNTQIETYPPSDPNKLRVVNLHPTVSLDTAKLAIDRGYENQDWVIFVLHNIASTMVNSTDWTPEALSALVDYVAAKGMPVRTVKQIREIQP